MKKLKLGLLGLFVGSALLFGTVTPSLRAQDIPNAADVPALTNLVNGAWVTNNPLARAMPPGLMKYTFDLGVIAAGSAFPLSNLVAGVSLGITNYPIEIIETNTTPRTRIYRDATGGVWLTENVPAGHTSNAWAEAVYGNPGSWMTSAELSAWYADRDPSRQHITMSLISTNDVPAYLAALTNAIGSYNDGGTSTPILILFSNETMFVKTDATDNFRTMYLHAPGSVTGFSVYVSSDLSLPTPGSWSLAARLPHNNDPLAYTHFTSIDFISYALGRAEDTDGDGLSNSDEVLLYGTDYLNADSDGDGLNDRQETLQYATNPFDADMDDDWFSDSYEAVHGFNPKTNASSPGLGFKINDGGFFVNSTNLVLHFDGLVASEVRIGENVTVSLPLTNAFTNTVSYALQSASNGIRSIFARLVRPGASSFVMVASCALDTVPPSLSVTNLLDNAVTNARWLWVRGVATDSVSAASVRINGEWADGVAAGSFRASHVMLTNGSNIITVTAEDAAHNVTTQKLTIVRDTTADASAPTVAIELPYDRTISGGVTNDLTTTTLPSNEVLHVQASADDETALLSCSSQSTNGSVMQGSVVQIGTQAWLSVALVPGTNLLVFTAVDAAGNTGTVQRQVIRDTALMFEITNPTPYQVINSNGVIVRGRADLRFTNATISVNGIACVLTNIGSHVEFRTSTAVPLKRSLGSLTGDAVVDGRVYFCDPPHGGAYEILDRWWEEASYDLWYGDGCGCYEREDTTTIWLDSWTSETAIWQTSYENGWTDASCLTTETAYGIDYTSGVDTTVSSEQWYGVDVVERTDPVGCGTPFHLNSRLYLNDNLTFRKTALTQETQTVIFQFLDLRYGRLPGTPVVPSNVTYRGQTGFWYNGNVAFIVPITIGKEYILSESDFTWPGYQYSTLGASGSGYSLSGHWLTFDGFTNDELKVSLDVGDGAGGEPDGRADDLEDGFENYIPGMRGTNPVISLSGSSVTLQLVKLIVRATNADHVVVTLSNVSTNRGFTTDTIVPPSTRDDVSFSPTEDSRVMSISQKTSEGDFIFDTYVGDYGASCRIAIDINGSLDGPPGPNAIYTNLIVDADVDGLADVWEKQKMSEWDTQYATAYPGGITALTPAADIEKNDPDGEGSLGAHSGTNEAGRGDGWTTLEEYRGCWFTSTSGFGGDSGFVRLSPARKELVVEVDRMVGPGSTELATSAEISAAMDLTRAAYLDTAGVQVHYVMDEPDAASGSLTNSDARISYMSSHYATTQPAQLWRDKYVWLLFGTGLDGDAIGLTAPTWFGSIVDCTKNRNAVSASNSVNGLLCELHSISFTEKLAATTTHELGHAAGCTPGGTFHYFASDLDTGIRIRLRPSYQYELDSWTWSETNGPALNAGFVFSQWNRQLIHPTNDSKTAQSVVDLLNAETNLFEAVAYGSLSSKSAWQLTGTAATIQRLSDGTPSSSWSLIRAESDTAGVMSGNHSPVNSMNVHFVNDPSVYGYAYEIGQMQVRLNHSRATTP